MRSYCLSFHARYRCQHSGACCEADWPIPIDAARIAVWRKRGLLKDPAAVERVPDSIGQPYAIAGRTREGACVFFETDGRLCSIHRQVGPSLMPSACRNFPRVALRDGRGLFVTLSHYCPTAARLLLETRDISIVPAPASLSLAGTVEGLDATGVMPPLLRPGMLMDFEGYAAWEGAAVAVLNECEYSSQVALNVIARATADVCAWRPGAECLPERVHAAFARARWTPGSAPSAAYGLLEQPAKAFLAAHLFASWSAYQDGGVMAVVESTRSVLAMFGKALGEDRSHEAFVAAVRSIDFRLRHREVGTGNL